MSSSQVNSKRSSPKREALPRRPNIRPNMSPSVLNSYISNDIEKEVINQSPKKYFQKTRGKVVNFCSFQSRILKKITPKKYKEHIPSPEKYNFITKKFPKIE